MECYVQFDGANLYSIHNPKKSHKAPTEFCFCIVVRFKRFYVLISCPLHAMKLFVIFSSGQFIVTVLIVPIIDSNFLLLNWVEFSFFSQSKGVAESDGCVGILCCNKQSGRILFLFPVCRVITPGKRCTD